MTLPRPHRRPGQREDRRSGYVLRIHVLWNAPALVIALVESSLLPLLSTMMISVGAFDFSEAPFALAAV
jgi:hypothetical protein